MLPVPWPEPHPHAGVAFGAAITVAALFISLPRVVTWRSTVPLLRDREISWRHVVFAAGLLALLGIWRPVLASVSLALGVLLVATAMDLTPVEAGLGTTEEGFEDSLTPAHSPWADDA